jgi:AraC family transcriptional regulator of adaptative response / DNA-3-methyladenine glycosylase II
MVIAKPGIIAGDARFPADICERALDSRDPRFDGLFYVGITTTGIYCRPVCPARVSHTERRRFFDSAAAAERAGFRPCLRCRPELAPGRAVMDAVSRLARAATQRIAAGALNGHSVAQLAGDLGVSERHLRRALERELGVSPLELAQTHRLLLAKQLLADTTLSVTRVAFASGFQSLRRFNSAFYEQYRLSPTELRRNRRAPRFGTQETPDRSVVQLALGYRPPLDWPLLLETLANETIPGTEIVADGRYARAVAFESRSGFITAEASGGSVAHRNHLIIGISVSLLPVLMPLLVRIRELFDLNAEPAAVDGHLAEGGLGALVRARPGLRIPGTLGGFEAILRVLLGSEKVGAGVVRKLGEPIETGISGVDRLLPTAQRIVDSGLRALVRLGMSRRYAALLSMLARQFADGALPLDKATDPEAIQRSLLEIDGMDEATATEIVARAFHWPDAFPSSDVELMRAAGAATPARLRAVAERWRPWRAYAARHLRYRG